MSRTREKIFMAVTVLLCVLLFAVKLTGSVWHVIFGIMLVILNVGHICMRFVKMRYQEKKVRIVDEVLMAALAIMFATGMLMHPLEGMLAVKILHKLSSVVFLLCMAGHVIQHRAVARSKAVDKGKHTSVNREKRNREKGGIYVS